MLRDVGDNLESIVRPSEPENEKAADAAARAGEAPNRTAAPIARGLFDGLGDRDDAAAGPRAESSDGPGAGAVTSEATNA